MDAFPDVEKRFTGQVYVDSERAREVRAHLARRTAEPTSPCDALLLAQRWPASCAFCGAAVASADARVHALRHPLGA